jgi:hypothetical protein
MSDGECRCANSRPATRQAGLLLDPKRELPTSTPGIAESGAQSAFVVSIVVLRRGPFVVAESEFGTCHVVCTLKTVAAAEPFDANAEIHRAAMRKHDGGANRT